MDAYRMAGKAEEAGFDAVLLKFPSWFRATS
jgi:hypothetical protein